MISNMILFLFINIFSENDDFSYDTFHVHKYVLRYIDICALHDMLLFFEKKNSIFELVILSVLVLNILSVNQGNEVNFCNNIDSFPYYVLCIILIVININKN